MVCTVTHITLPTRCATFCKSFALNVIPVWPWRLLAGQLRFWLAKPVHGPAADASLGSAVSAAATVWKRNGLTDCGRAL